MFFLQRWICGLFCGEYKEEINALRFALSKKISLNIVKPPKPKKWITADEFYRLIEEQLPVSKETIRILGAEKYALLPDRALFEFLKADLTDTIPYTNTYVCRNFALKLLGDFQIPDWDIFAVALIWANGHAFNLYVNQDKIIKYIEPQTDEVFLPSSSKGKRFNQIGLIFG